MDNSYQSNINKELISNNFEYASIGSRLVAFLIDSSLYTIIIYFILFVISFAISMISKGDNDFFIFTIQISLLAVYFGQPFYCIIAETGKKHRTIGKKAMKIVVKNKDGSYLNFSQSLLRNLIKLISYFIPFGILISFIMAQSSSEHQSIHDVIMKQIVVKEK